MLVVFMHSRILTTDSAIVVRVASATLRGCVKSPDEIWTTRN